MIHNSLDLLFKPFRTLLEEKIKGERIAIFETYRAPSRQTALFTAGHSKAKAWQSWHQYGLAVDIVFLDDTGNVTWNGDYDALASKLKCDKIAWSGDWKNSYERCHFEWKHSISIQDAATLVATEGTLALWARLLSA